jgi:hypothetical protein
VSYNWSEEAYRRMGEVAIKAQLAPLDWQHITCQCGVHYGGCRNQGAKIVVIHAVGACDQPGLDEDGNRVEIRCTQCVEQLRREIDYKIRRLNRVSLGRACCEPCGAPLGLVSDVLREVKDL